MSANSSLRQPSGRETVGPDLETRGSSKPETWLKRKNWHGTQPWHKLYKTARWHRIRDQQLSEQPLCQRCLDSKPSRITPATIVHHVNRHHGDPVLFFQGPYASSCKPCHDSIEQGIERRGYDTTIGEDGFPTDPAHPVNKKRK